MTDVSLDEAAELTQAQELMPATAAASERLAVEVVRWVHGEQAAEAARRATAALYSGGEDGPREAALALARALAVGEGAGATAVLRAEEVVGAGLLDVCALSGLSASKGEARRLIQAGGLSVNEVRCGREEAGRVLAAEDLLDGGLLLLRAGKKRHRLVRISPARGGPYCAS